MLGNSSFGFSGDGTGGVSPITGGGTLNYIAKFTPSGTVIGDSLFFDNGVSAGLGTATPSASALLEISSTTQGFLTPRMTTAQRNAIASPSTGLLIYNISSSFFNYWDGTTWIQIDSSTGGDVSGSGTTNYGTLWTDGANSVLGDAPVKYGDTTTRSAPVNAGTNSIALGYDTTLSGADNYSYGYGLSVNGTGTFVYGHTVSIDDVNTGYGTGNIFSFGSAFSITGGQFVDAIVQIGFASSITATSETRGVYMFGDTHICTDYVTYSTLIGESCNFTRVDHTTAIGIFTNVTDSAFIYTYGEGTTIDNSNTVINFGSYNSISASTNLSVFGSGNTITDTDKLYIGNNNNNVVVDGLTGFTGIGTANPTERLELYDASAPFALKAFINNSLSSGYAELMMTTDISDMRFGAGGSGATPYGGSAGDCYFGAVSYSNLILATNNTVRMSIRKDGEVGIGTGVGTPSALFHVLGVSATGFNQTLEPVLNVTEKVSGNTVNTTDATVTTIQTIAIPTDKVLMIETRVTARKTAGAGVGTVNDGNGYVRTATYANIAGVVTLSGAVQTSYTGEGIGAFNVTLVISGTDVLIRVTGAANDDVTWNSITRTYEV